MANSKTAIINKALVLCGAATVTNITDGTPNANALSNVYQISLQSILSECKWNFATSRATLSVAATSSTTPAFFYTGEKFVYALPGNIIRIFDVNPREAYWREESGQIISDTDNLGILYVYYDDNPDDYPSYFLDAFIDKLCSDIAYLIINSAGVAEAFIKKYKLLANDPASPEPIIQLDRADRAFLEHCLAWREFLFDDSRQPRKHQLKITLDDEQGQDSRNAEKYFTQLLISGLEVDKDKAIRLRFSGQRFKSASVNWEFSLNSEIYLEAKNEETGLTTAIRLSGGGLAFPAYVAWEGRRKQAGPSADLRLNMLFPKTGGAPGEAAYVVPISVNWDQKLPEPISWPGR